MMLSTDKMFDIDRIPDTVLMFMEKLKFHHATFPNVMLAGGAPRDLFFDKDVTDWDFFIPHRLLSYRATLERMLFDLGYMLDDSGRPDPSYEKVDGIFHTHTYKRYGDKIQLIYSDQKLEEFDISTCQIGITMDGDVITTPHFDTSASTQVHFVYLKAWKTLYQLTNGLGSHLPRVLAKYPWTVILDTKGVDNDKIAAMRAYVLS